MRYRTAEAAEKTEEKFARRHKALEEQYQAVIAEHEKYGMDPGTVDISVDDRRYLRDDAAKTLTARQNIVPG